MKMQLPKLEWEPNSDNFQLSEKHSETGKMQDEVKRLSLKTNFYWTLAGNIVYTVCQWGMLVILAKLGNPSEVGQFALGLAITSPVIMFLNLQLRSVQATDAKLEYGFGDYLALRITTSAFAFITFLIIAAALNKSLETKAVILMIGIAKISESVSDIYFGLLQQYERMDRIAKSLIVRGILSAAALWLAYYFTRSVFWACTAIAASWIAILIIYDIKSGHLLAINKKYESMTPKWNFKTLYDLAILALPLGIVMLLISLNSNIPRYFIERYFGEHDLGIFAAMAYLIVAGSTVVNALTQSASPRLAIYYAEGKAESFRNLLMKLTGFGILLGIMGILIAAFAGKLILTVFYGPEYARHSTLFIWIATASLITHLQWFLGSGMTAARCFRAQVPILAGVTAVTLIASQLLIPDYRLIGAALALIAGAIVSTIGAAIVNVSALRKIEFNLRSERN